MFNSGIYSIKRRGTEEQYIGSSMNIAKRRSTWAHITPELA